MCGGGGENYKSGYSLSPDLANAATVSVSLIEGNEGKTAKFGEKWSWSGKI